MLVLSNGELVTVEFVQHEILESPIKVYNFEVEDFHTYFVGECGVLVHNDCTYSRVQGGGENVDKRSRDRITVNSDGTINISKNGGALYISEGTEHADYFFNIRGEGAYTVQFDLPDWVSDAIHDNAISQKNATKNPFNDYLPKIVDSTTPGISYQMPSSWLEFIESVATNGRIV